MTDVTNGENRDVEGLSAADEQLLKELTERARAGGLKLTGEGGTHARFALHGVTGTPTRYLRLPPPKPSP